MKFIDQEGRVFGLVNVIDALVVLLVVAIVVAGVALVTQSGTQETTPETGSVIATIDLGVQPGYLVEQLSTGDTVSPDDTSNLTITDVYVAPQDGGARVLVTAELEGPVSEETIIYAGAPPRVGRQLTLQTNEYQAGGTIRSIGDTLDRRTTRVLLESTMDASTANQIETGDTVTIGNHEVAVIESIEAFGTGTADVRRVYVGVSLATVQFGDGPQFGNRIVRTGTNIPLTTDEYALQGTVRRVGMTSLPGESGERSVTVELEGIRPALASNLRVGQSEVVQGDRIALITRVDSRPARVVLTSQDGQLYLREHPIERDVTLTVRLAVRETDTGPTFKGRPLQPGGTIVLDFGTVSIEATVTSI